jgi:hypothetical protein
MYRKYAGNDRITKNRAWAVGMETLEDRRMNSAAPAQSFVAMAPVAASTAPANPAVPTASLAVMGIGASFGDKGLSQLCYNGVTLFDLAAHPEEGFRVLQFEHVNPAGGDAGGTFLGSTWHPNNKTLVYSYDWGSIKTRYTVSRNKLTIAVSVFNNTPADTIRNPIIIPFSVRFPNMPAYSNGCPMMSFGDDPTAQVADYGTGAMAVVNEDPTRRLYNGLFSDNTTSQTNRFNVWIGAGPIWYQPTSWPVFNRSIGPNSSDTYSISLRFGPTGSTVTSMAGDMLKAFAAAKPQEEVWTDRRPIGELMPAGSGPNKSATNPRGWFNDPTVDVTTQAGLANFRDRLLAWADTAVQVLKSMNAQGGITWDIEGEQDPSITYVGDPRLATTLAPELNYDDVVDAYFKKFTDAGLRTGVTIRPQQLTMVNGQWAQLDNVDKAAVLIDKINYAQSRWGCTLFYIDSNSWADNPAVYQKVHEACPDVLLIPENQNAGMYAYGSAYDPLGDTSGTPDSVRTTYPTAFTVIDVTAGQDNPARTAALVKAVSHGDVLLFHGWYDDWMNNARVTNIYNAAGGVPQIINGQVVPPSQAANALPLFSSTPVLSDSPNNVLLAA